MKPMITRVHAGTRTDTTLDLEIHLQNREVINLHLNAEGAAAIIAAITTTTHNDKACRKKPLAQPHPPAALILSSSIPRIGASAGNNASSVFQRCSAAGLLPAASAATPR